MEERFPAASRDQMMQRLNASGEPYGIHFANNPRLSNSRLALAASEFARDTGMFHVLHKRLFEAYFGQAEDIGNIDVLMNIATEVGLDSGELRKALDDGRYAQALEEGQAEGQRYGVTGTPTFIINNKYKVVGAQPLEVMRRALNEIMEREQSEEG